MRNQGAASRPPTPCATRSPGRCRPNGRRYACLRKSAFYLETCDPLKMPAIVCKQRQVMTQGRSGNQQIKIADQFSGAAQGAAELPETPAYFLVDAQDDDAGKKFGEHRFTPGGVLGKVHTSH